MRVISCDDDVDHGLKQLLAIDPRLLPIAEVSGPLPLRLREPGFEGLARIVISQQVSVASAAAIWDRLVATVTPFEAETIDRLSDEDLQGAGLSRPKIKTLRALVDATSGGLDLRGLHVHSAEEAFGQLVAVKGIGPWTADVFLMFCLGHADAFAPGDLALQAAAATAFNLPARPSADELHELAEAWRPWRSVAARLLWAYYRVCRDGRDTLPV